MLLAAAGQSLKLAEDAERIGAVAGQVRLPPCLPGRSQQTSR
jgi:hypothetical protein